MHLLQLEGRGSGQGSGQSGKRHTSPSVSFVGTYRFILQPARVHVCTCVRSRPGWNLEPAPVYVTFGESQCAKRRSQADAWRL